MRFDGGCFRRFRRTDYRVPVAVMMKWDLDNN